METKIFITGATGAVGSQLVKKLAALHIPFKALVRTNDKADLIRQLPNAEVLVGSLADEAFLANALRGTEKAFLLTNSSAEAAQLQLSFVNAAGRAGVPHLVKLSQYAASKNSPVRFLRYHAQVEDRIKELGLTYTFLRPNLFMQGLLAFASSVKTEGRFYAAIGHAAVSIVDTRDIAAVAAAALTKTGHENKTYTITGPEALTHYQLADILSGVLEKPVSFIDVAPEHMQEALKAAGLPEWQLAGILEDYAHYARGEAAAVDDTVSRVTSAPATRFEQFVRDHKFLFI
ncbi:SDR family oxidoreductase [Niabella beijingensis]|uniref:SDR family oxidoreductase n=1 Tax=Niabella beijingensis TaxID=2872700 RepID=UPI001CBFA90B|nr:SDR family oxidoreductase [Niabella beijingensis]MBZ4189414.1 SDR family oxidoreductase [Niabella beijingensis]